MARGDYRQAITLYREAINNPKLELSGRHTDEREDLQAFARFRIMVAHTLLGERDLARAARNEFHNAQPYHMYRAVAQVYWDAYAPPDSISAGCKAVTVMAQTNANISDVLSDFGYANPDFKAEDVCPFH